MYIKISSVFRALYLYFAGILSVVLLYILLIRIEQGIDVLIQSGESWRHFLWTCLCILLWALLAWYSARLVSYAKQNQDDGISLFLHKHLPRLIAWNCFICIQAAIVSLVFTDFFTRHPGWHTPVIPGFILVQNLLYVFLVSCWESPGKKINRKWTAAVYIVMAIYIIFWIAEAIRHVNLPWYMRHRYLLCWMAPLLFIFQLGALVFFILRRKSANDQLAGTDEPGNTFGRGGRVSSIAMNAPQAKAEKNHFFRFNVFAGCAVMLYLIAIFSPAFSRAMASLALVLLSLGVLTGFANMISCLSIRLHVNLNVPLFILAIIIGFMGDPYRVRLLKTPEHNLFSHRPGIGHYFDKWLGQRKALLDDPRITDFDVYIVLSDGGGSRSANWVCGMLSAVQDSSYKTDTANSFAAHLLCLAGASGGTVGNCAFYSLLRAQENSHTTGLLKHSYGFFASDFLSPPLVRLLGPDFFRHIIPVPMYDRAAALEMAIEQGGDSLIAGYFKKPIQDVLDSSGRLPFLFINSTGVRDGNPGEISSSLLPDSSLRTNILSLVDASGDSISGRSIRFSTAAVLSARFPYLSPAGGIRNNYFVDGGYFDNSGSGIVLEFMEQLKKCIDDPADTIVQLYREKLRFNIIHISNFKTPVTKAKKPMHPLTNDLLAPLLTIAGMGGSTTTVDDGLLDNYFKTFDKRHPGTEFHFNLFDSTEDFPMSWVISRHYMYLMRQRVAERFREKYPLLSFR